MNTDDRALADLIARLRARKPTSFSHAYGAEGGELVNPDGPAAADRLEAFHAKPVVGELPGVLKHCKALVLSTGREIPVIDGLVALPVDLTDVERTEMRGIIPAALQSPPPVVSGEAAHYPERIIDIAKAIHGYDERVYAATSWDELTDKQLEQRIGQANAVNQMLGLAILALTPVEGVGEIERNAVRDYLLACAAEADRQRLNMLSGGHKLTARDCGSESKAYANAAAMIEREDHASYRAALSTP